MRFKRITATLLVAIVLVSSLMAGCSKKIQYYSDTSVPTFTSVTGVEISKTGDFTVEGTKIGVDYTYECSESEINKYISYLESNGFTEVDVQNGSDGIRTFRNDKQNVMIATINEGNCDIVPYEK